MTKLWWVFDCKHHRYTSLVCKFIVYIYLHTFFTAQAQDIQKLYRILTETQVQCLVCSSVQTRSSYLLSLPLPLRDNESSLVRFLFIVFKLRSFSTPESSLTRECVFFRKAV